MRVLLVAIGVGTAGPNGSFRYLSCLREGLAQLRSPHVGTELLTNASLPTRMRRLSERMVKLSWSLIGLPDVGDFTVSADISLAHSVESVNVPRSRKYPLVVTAHDVCGLLRPDLVSRTVAWAKKLSWRRWREWDAVIAPSQATADDLLHLGLEHDRIRLIRHGLPARVSQPVSSTTDSRVHQWMGEGPFVLAVMTPSRKKGADVLLRTWRSVRSRSAGKLAWVGASRSALESGFRNLIDDDETSRIVCVGSVGDQLLSAFYRRAEALIMPSRWEGFSFPVAEALALGRPVIASDIPAHREFLTGRVGLMLFDLSDEDTLSEMIVSALDGRLSGTKYSFPSWLDVAGSHAAVYASLASV